MILNVQARQQSLADEFGLDFDDLEELQSLVDQVLNEQTDDDGFLIFLRLPTVPQYLVEAFDFKMLNRYFALPNNFSRMPNKFWMHASQLSSQTNLISQL